MNKQLDQLLQQKMDRKNFLKHVALAAVMMTGAASIVKVFHNPEEQKTAGRPQVASGYGSAAYGGAPSTTPQVR